MQDGLKKKERELMAKEAELNRREQVYTSHLLLLFNQACMQVTLHSFQL